MAAFFPSTSTSSGHAFDHAGFRERGHRQIGRQPVGFDLAQELHECRRGLRRLAVGSEEVLSLFIGVRYEPAVLIDAQRHLF